MKSRRQHYELVQKTIGIDKIEKLGEVDIAREKSPLNMYQKRGRLRGISPPVNPLVKGRTYSQNDVPQETI